MEKAERRKATPVYSGVLMYFPDAIYALARLSQIGNDQHNPGEDLRWDRSKSGDEKDAEIRHAIEAGCVAPMDDDDTLHATKDAWRSLADLQKTLERMGLAPLSPYNGMTNEEMIEAYLESNK